MALSKIVRNTKLYTRQEKNRMLKRTIRHEELKGDYTMEKKIIIDACEISGEFEVMAMYEDGEELESKTVTTEIEAIKVFDDLFMKYAEPLQCALYNKLHSGKKYTLVYLNDFGFPVAEKITFHSVRSSTYAQHSDVMEMIFTPYRKRTQYRKLFYSCSMMIFEGWQDLKEEEIKETLEDNKNVKITKSKYGCFDSRYIDDLENCFKNPVVIFKNYKTGVNGKIYA